MITRESLEKLCRRQVKVLSKRKIHRQRFIYIVGLLFLVLLLFLPMLFHHNKSEVIPTNESDNVTNYHSALEANLARLHQLRAGIAKKVKSVHLTQAANHSNRLSKLQKLRQHAPTRMYVADSSSASFSKNSSLTFMDKSPYAKFANQSSQAPIMMAQRLAHPDSTIPQGEFIHAILETAIDSDLPGMIRAVVTRPVYSYRGDHLLIPEGSRLIGQYSSQTPQGINRVMVVLAANSITEWRFYSTG